MRVITEDIFAFLNKLKKNNNREWFNENKPEFKKLESSIKEFYFHVFENLSQHDQIQKWRGYRIYRDVRFSKDKTPYKKHFAAEFQRKKPELRGGYYLHIEPNNQSFLGVGFWNPEKEDVLRVRKEWEIDAEDFREIISHKQFKSIWGEMEGEKLITAPKGFNKENKNIDLINYKQWLFTHRFKDEEVLSKNFLQEIDKCFQAIRPFFDYMSDVLTTDLNGESIL